MRFDVITLFPELFEPFVRVGITRRAFESGAVELHCFNPRDVVTDTYRRVDDRPFGGGPGMVFMAQPLLDTLAVMGLREEFAQAVEVCVVLHAMQPRGPVVMPRRLAAGCPQHRHHAQRKHQVCCAAVLRVVVYASAVACDAQCVQL